MIVAKQKPNLVVLTCLLLLPVVASNVIGSPIKEKLKEIVKLRENELELQQRLYSEQRISDVTSARISLVRARINLAKERGEAGAVVEQLEVIVAVRKLNFETARIREEMNAGSTVEARIELLQAEIELERAKKTVDGE
jgi:hypothetical protein